MSVAETAKSDDAFAEGSLVARMLRIAVPLSITAGFRYAVDLSNAYWVGKLGVAALAIVTALGTFLSLSKMFAGLTSAGTSAVVGRMVGEGRPREALRVAQKVTAIAPVLGVFVAFLALAVSGPAKSALGLEGASGDAATRYLLVVAAGLPFSFGLLSVNGVLVGLGRPRASVVASSTSLVVGFIVTPVMLRYFHVGVWGAALAQVLGDACGYVVGARAVTGFAREYGALPWRRRFAKLGELWPVFRVGAPLTADAVIHASVWFGLVAFLSRYGSEYVAAQGAEERLTQILNLPTEGIAPAAATLVGYFLGRGDRDKALKTVWMALGMVAAVAAVGATLLRLTPGPVVAWLCADPNFVHVGAEILAIAALGLAFLGGRDVMEASFGGTGNTVPPVVIGLVIALSRFPLAYLLAVKLGLAGYGVAWAVNTSLVVQTVLLIVWFLARFRRIEVRALAPINASVPPPPLSPSEIAEAAPVVVITGGNLEGP